MCRPNPRDGRRARRGVYGDAMGARLFTAILPPTSLVEDLDHFLAPRRTAEPRLRWTRPESWHLTTAFMASVPDTSSEPLVGNLAEVAARTPAFRLRLGGGGAFPWPVEAKVLWLGVPEGAEELAQLAERCRTGATRAGVRVDGARFRPHLTLARANRALDTTRLVRVLDTFDADGWDATELLLIESHLHDPGNRYEVVGRWPLGSSGETPGSGGEPRS